MKLVILILIFLMLMKLDIYMYKKAVSVMTKGPSILLPPAHRGLSSCGRQQATSSKWLTLG